MKRTFNIINDQPNITPGKIDFSTAQAGSPADTGTPVDTTIQDTGSGFKKKMKRRIILGKGADDVVVETKQRSR